MKLRSILTELVPINMHLPVARARFIIENHRQLSVCSILANQWQHLRPLRADGTSALHIILNGIRKT